MGLTHLRKVEDFLRNNRHKQFFAKDIMQKFGMNYNTLRECLAYLAEQRKINVIKEGKKTKYQWRRHEITFGKLVISEGSKHGKR